MELSIGTSFPLPPFSQKNIENTGAGFAKPGGLVNLKVGKRIGKENFELGLAIRASINGFDSNPVTEEYERNNQGYYQPWNRDIKGWKVISLMPAFIYNASVNKKTNFKVGMYIGPAYAQSQQFILKGNSTNGSFTSTVEIRQKSVDAVTLSTSIQAGLYFTLTDKLDFVISTDYFYLKPTFKDSEASMSGAIIGPFPGGGTGPVSVYRATRRFNFVQNMNSVNIGVGLKYRFQ